MFPAVLGVLEAMLSSTVWHVLGFGLGDQIFGLGFETQILGLGN